MAVGGLKKVLKKAGAAIKNFASRRANGHCGSASEPIYVVTGENFNRFTDFVSGGLFEWRRHYTTARHRDDGPLGHVDGSLVDACRSRRPLESADAPSSRPFAPSRSVRTRSRRPDIEPRGRSAVTIMGDALARLQASHGPDRVIPSVTLRARTTAPRFDPVNWTWFAAKVGIALIHATPYMPHGKGKMERWFRTVRVQYPSSATTSSRSSEAKGERVFVAQDTPPWPSRQVDRVRQVFDSGVAAHRWALHACREAAAEWPSEDSAHWRGCQRSDGGCSIALLARRTAKSRNDDGFQTAKFGHLRWPSTCRPRTRRVSDDAELSDTAVTDHEWSEVAAKDVPFRAVRLARTLLARAVWRGMPRGT
jgi:hypothetical protein